MGKKHNFEENSGRRGRSDNRYGGHSEGSRKATGRPTGDREERRFGGNDNRGGNYPSRPAFGRSTERRPGGEGFGGKRFGGSEGSNRASGAKSGTGFGPRRSSDDRHSFDRDRDSREGGFERRGSDRSGSRYSERDERPVRSFEPKNTWKGQPYRQDGQPTVPRGEKGERNRKFIKTSPFEAGPKVTPQPDDSRFGDNNNGADRPVRPARPFDYQRPPAAFRKTDEEPSRENRYERRERGEGNFNPRSTGERSLGNRGFGSDRREGKPGRATGERRSGDKYEPTTTFRALREAARKEQSHSPYKRDANQAGRAKRGEVAGQAPDYKNLKHYEADKNRGNKRRRNEEDFGTETMRLNRYIANAGICSRRDADALIAAGEIRVNGEVVTEMGYQVQPSDTVQYGKTNLKREKLVYVLLNKPKDFITTTDDPEGRRTVMELVAGASTERLFPVGRLDRNTTGLLLFTNDGEVAQKLSHPSHKNKKIYQVELDKPLSEEHLRQIAAGLELEDGKAEVDDVAVVAGNAHFVGVELHLGRNRIVRRIFEHLGYEVVTLDRVQYAGLTKKDPPRGKWRFLNEKEVIRLKYFL